MLFRRDQNNYQTVILTLKENQKTKKNSYCFKMFNNFCLLNRRVQESRAQRKLFHVFEGATC